MADQSSLDKNSTTSSTSTTSGAASMTRTVRGSSTLVQLSQTAQLDATVYKDDDEIPLDRPVRALRMLSKALAPFAPRFPRAIAHSVSYGGAAQTNAVEIHQDGKELGVVWIDPRKVVGQRTVTYETYSQLVAALTAEVDLLLPSVAATTTDSASQESASSSETK